jgi:hypothetical protein
MYKDKFNFFLDKKMLLLLRRHVCVFCRHRALSVPLIVFPFAYVDSAINPRHVALPMPHAVLSRTSVAYRWPTSSYPGRASGHFPTHRTRRWPTS